MVPTSRLTIYTDCMGTDSHNNSREDLVLHRLNVLSGAEGLSNRSSIGVSSLFFTMRADRTVITFRALPSIVTANTTRTGGSEENWEREKENNCAFGNTEFMNSRLWEAWALCHHSFSGSHSLPQTNFTAKVNKQAINIAKHKYCDKRGRTAGYDGTHL